jgi:Tfp pilus assembly protein PilO
MSKKTQRPSRASSPSWTQRSVKVSAPRPVLMAALVPVVVTAAAAYALVIRPSAQSADADQRRYDQLAAEVATAERQLAASQAVSSQSPDDAAAQLDALRLAFPGDIALGGFLVQLGDVASAAGVEVTSTTPLEVDPALPGEQRIDLILTGGDAALADALTRLRSMPRFVQIDRVEVTRSAGSSTLSATIRVFSTITTVLGQSPAPSGGTSITVAPDVVPQPIGAVAPTSGAIAAAPGAADPIGPPRPVAVPPGGPQPALTDLTTATP